MSLKHSGHVNQCKQYRQCSLIDYNLYSALAWSQSGSLLATGSDDRRVILWKLGSSDEHPQALQIIPPHARQRGYPKLDLAQADVIETGHRANIFNIKWAPHCSDQRLFTCAGDSQVRVFDLSRATTSSFMDRRLESGKEYKIWREGQGACTRVLRCHSGRAKKISTENSPDIFLTAAEDGEVRQTDLRVSHTCSRSSQSYGQGCPRPLMQFKMELYSISVSKLEPWLFAIAGTSDKVYLQDRRMIPRLLKNEWGSYLDDETAALTHCVRRFARKPKTTNGEDSAAATRRFDRAHVTAVKISEANGRDIIASYSADGVYRFDIKGDSGLARREESGLLPSSVKRRKTSSSGTLTPRADAESNVDWNKIRAKTIRILFASRSDTIRISKTYSQLSKDLSRLLHFIQSSSASTTWLANQDRQLSEKSVIALCQTLLHIMRCTSGRTETVEMNLDSQREYLEYNLTIDVREVFVSLIDELQEANKWKAYSEEVKIRILLWDRAEEYVKSLWEPREIEIQGTVLEQDSTDEIRSIDEDLTPEEQPTSTDVDILSFQRRFQAVAGEESRDDLGPEERDNLLRALMTDAPSELDMEEDEYSMDDDDDNDDDDDDDDVNVPSTFRDSSEEEEEESNRHGISGGNASIVYPSACYLGHANNETVKDCGFLGSNDEYIWSGSDCGHFFVWTNDERCELKGIWKGDGSVVNVLTSHPVLPICAVSGIDNTVKIFGPINHGDKRFTDAFDRREDIMSRNSQQER